MNLAEVRARILKEQAADRDVVRKVADKYIHITHRIQDEVRSLGGPDCLNDEQLEALCKAIIEELGYGMSVPTSAAKQYAGELAKMRAT